MSEPLYSFVYDRSTADAAFHGIAIRELMLSLLAGIQPQDAWDGVTVFEGESPIDGPTACIGISGPGADALQLQLIEGLERQGVRVLEVYEGGPPPRTLIATARGGQWSTP